MKLKVILAPSEEGGYTVYVPALPGCISEGDTREEALANIRKAIELVPGTHRGRYSLLLKDAELEPERFLELL